MCSQWDNVKAECFMLLLQKFAGNRKVCLGRNLQRLLESLKRSLLNNCFLQSKSSYARRYRINFLAMHFGVLHVGIKHKEFPQEKSQVQLLFWQRILLSWEPHRPKCIVFVLNAISSFFLLKKKTDLVFHRTIKTQEQFRQAELNYALTNWVVNFLFKKFFMIACAKLRVVDSALLNLANKNSRTIPPR